MSMDPQDAILQLVAVVFALSFHEMAHAWAAFRLGDSTARDQGRLTMNPIVHIDPVMTILFPLVLFLMNSPVIFGAARPVPVQTENLENPKRDHMWIAAAGPLSNILLAAGTVVLIRLFEDPLLGLSSAGAAWALPLARLLRFHLVLNLILAAFNLIPLHPLDGSWILSRFLNGRAAAAYASLRPYGFIILIGLFWAGYLDAVIFEPVFAVTNALVG